MSDPLARLRSTALLSCLLVLAACSGGSPSQGGGSGAPLDLRGETPEQGPASGGNPVDVTGDGFTEGVTVAFGGAVSSSVKVIDAHTLRAIAPPHAPGRVGMDVTRPDGKSFHRPDCYEYIAAPALSSIEPGQVPVAGNVSVVLVGTGFQPGAVVSFGGIPATATQWLDAGRLTAVAPPHAGGGRVDVTVRNPDGQQSTMGGGLNYLDPPPPPPPPPPAPPTLAALSPITGPISGGTQVTLSGSGFVDGAQVRFGANPATVSSVQPTQIVALTPLGAVGGVDVVVVNPDGQVATLAGGFTYFQPPPPAPSIGSAAPTSGPTSGGTVVGLTGANFKPGATVSIGGIGAPVVGAVTSTHIDVTTPAHGPGTVDIVVANPDGQRGTLAGGFAYVAPPPTLASISVTRGPVAGGTAVTLSGTGFLASAAVTVGGVTAPVVGVTPTSIAITTPPHAAGAADVVVTNTDGQSASLAGAFTYLGPAPAISTIAPASGPVAGSTAVTVTGTGFGAAATVSFGGVLAAVTTRSATALGVTAPPHATGTVDVVVANPDGQVATSIGGYTYLAAAPAIASFSPASGPDVGGPPATVTVTGTGFQPSASVSVGGAGAVVLAASATSITVLVPVHPAGPAAISVTNPDGQTATSSSSFTFTAAPSIASVTPPGGPAAGGTLVTVAGAAFQAGASVTVGGVAVASTFVSATTLTFTAPAHAAGAADVVVTNPAPDARQAAKAAAFTFTSAPAIASLSPASGFAAGGQTLTVAGSGFQAPTSVTVGGAAATLGPWTATQITVTTPRGTPGPAAVVVTNADGQTATAPVPFAYVAAPAVAGVSPPSGPASLATAITVSGSGFQPGATVTVGGATATAVAVAANGASLTATAPPHAPGLVDVAVANPDGQRSALPGAFTYVAGPSITSLAPASGPTSGGTAVSVTGSGFQAGSTVTFGGAALPAAGVTVTPTLVTFVTPPGPAGVAGVTIVGPDGQSASSPAAFTYLAPPALAAVAPASGSTLGGDALVLSGTGFRAGATVTIGGVSAAVGPVTATTIAVTSPPHAAGPVAVTVANADGQSSTLAAAYTYVAPPPALLSIAPTSGPEAGGTIVVLTGANFSGAAVTIGGLPATVSVAATASLTVTAPAHAAGPADVVVTNADGQKATLAGAFTYVAPPPRFLSLTPASGPTAGGGTLTVAGSGFQPGATATLGGAAAAVGAVTPTSLTLTAPPHAAGAVDLVVVNPDRQSFTAAAAYTYVAPAPAIASALPASGPSAGGTKVTVAGSGFAATAAVALGGSPVVGLAVAPGGGSLTFTTPPHAAGAAALSVTNPDGQAATLAGAFTFVAPPVLSAVAPLAGPIAGGTPLTLSGSGFQAGATVTVAGVAATGVALSGAASITAVAPPHAAGPADVVVTNPDGQSSTLAAAFTYRAPPPAIASVSPASGLDAGGTTVLVTGTGFSAAAVTFGGAPALVLGASATSLTVSSPVHPAGPVDVVVTNGDGQAATATAAFTYAAAPPAIASIAPTSGSTGGGTAVTIAGSGFQPGASVAIGGVAAVVGSTSATAIVASTPAHAAGLADVVVTNPDGQKATLAGAFTFVAPPPAIAGLAPASGPTAGGTAVTLTGSAFQPGATVSVGGVAAAVGAVAPTSIALTTPAHAFGAVDVVVTNPDGRSATLAGGFTYVAPAPTFVAVAPASGPTAGGNALTVSGTGFLPGAAVAVGGVPATVGTLTATSIALTAPPHAFGPVSVVVTNPDGKSVTGASAYTYVAPPPSIASVTPAAGPLAGGNALTVAGANFLPGATVSVGGLAAAVTSSSATAIVATAPAHAAGATDVVVTNPDGQGATLAAGYAYRLPPPTVASISPATGLTGGGAVVTVTGTGFQAGAAVALGGTAATGVTVASGTSLSFVAPAHAAGPAALVLTNPDGQAATLAAAFTYVAPAPALASLAPASGADVGGTTVVLSGSAFQPNATVSFGGVAGLVLAASPTAITATTPAHVAGLVDVTVTNPDGQASTLAAAFTFVGPPPPPAPPPVLASLSPLSGPDAGGTTVVLAGSAFQNGATVTMGGVAAAILSTAPTSISVTAPPHLAGAVDVVVTNPDGQKSTLLAAYSYVAPAPAIASIAPSSGPGAGGTALTLTGSAFQALATVTVGGAAAPVTASSATSITVTTPAHAPGAVPVVVRNPDGQTATAATLFTYLAAPPAIAAVAPATGSTAGGTAVTVTGTGFQAGATVTLAGATVAASVTATSIAFTAPAHAAGAGDLVVTNPDGQSATRLAAFTWVTPPPALVAVTPGSGSTLGGTAVTATGSGFQVGAAVTVGGTPATAVTVASATSLAFTAPAHAAGAAAVTVTNPDGQSSTLAAGFTYVAPAPSIASVAPASGPAAGGTALTITGANFQPAATISVGGAAAVVTASSPTSITATAPAHAAGLADVTVTNPDGQGATSVGAFRYLLPAPAIASVTPSSGPTAGGTAVTVAGSNFQAGATVTFGGVAVTAAVTAGSITFTAPAHAAGPVALLVVNPDGQSASLAAAFTYLAPPVLASVAPATGSTLGGTTLVLSGSAFATGATVTVGGVAAAIVSAGAASITVTTPPHAAGAVDVVVTNPDGQAATAVGAFRYVAPPPAIASVSPASGTTLGGTALTIAGSAFQAGATVTVGGVAATGVTVTATSVSATAPAHAAGAVAVVVTNPDGQLATAAGAFTYVAPPVLAAVAPSSGPTAGGTAVTLTGTGFGAGATVSFGGAVAVPSAVTSTGIAVAAPAHAAGAVAVTVTNADGQASTLAGAYTYVAPPAIVSVAPTSGTTVGGTAVTVTGSGFQAGASVTLGGVAVVPTITATSITFTTPGHAAGPVALVVTNPDGQGATAAAAFSYVAPPPPPPTLASVAPAGGPVAGGTAVTLTGTGFQALATVTIGGLPAAITSAGATSIVATAPAHAAGAADVVVTNPDGQKATLVGGYTYRAPPAIASVAPASGPTAGGAALTLTGSAFQIGAAVAVGGVAATVGTVTATTIALTAPPHAAGPADVVVTNPDGQQATLPAAFTYLAPPAIASVAPASGPAAGGTAVTITGSAFQVGATVAIGGVAATVGPLTATTIAVTAPPHAAGPADVVVTNPDGQKATLAASFTYVAPPAITSAAPGSGPAAGGTAVTLTGTGFQAGATLTAGGTAVPATVASATSLTFVAPAHATGAGDLVVTNPDGQKATLVGGFSWIAAPALATVAPATGPVAGGAAVTLTGSSFQLGATVTFGGTAGAVSAVSATTINVTAPAHAAGAVDVVVTNPDGQKATLAGAFTYRLPPPALASVAPAVGTTAGGTAVTLAGTGFVAGATVSFGGTAATGVVATATSISATTPAHAAAGAVDVVVTNPDGQAATLALGFTYRLPAPTVAGTAPAFGPDAGGTSVVVSGASFQPGATVSFGGAAATVLGTPTATAITVTTAAHPAGVVAVTVTNPDAQSGTLAAAYTYRLPAPTIAGVAPASGPVAGGTTVTVSGSGFVIGAAATVGGAAATVSAVTAAAVTLVTPPGAAGPAAIVVTNPDGQSGTLAGAFTYVAPPAIASVAPATGSTAGGTALAISGAGFQAGATVVVGGAATTGVAVTPTTISATTSAHAAGAADVVVTNPDGQKATAAGAFTFVAPTPPPTPAPTLASVTPNQGSTGGGTTVILGGTNFVTGATVAIGGVPAAVTGLSATAISCTSGAHAAGAADVVVTNPDGQSATLAAGYTFVSPAPPPVLGPPPSLTGVTPASGLASGGAVLTLAGASFQLGATVTVGGVAAPVTAAVAGAITAISPAHAAGLVDVVVTNPDGQTATLPGSFTFTPLPALPPPPASCLPGAPAAGCVPLATSAALTSLTPITGSITGGDTVTLSGSNFNPAVLVTFDTGNFATVVNVTATTVTVQTPPHAAGLVSVTATNPDGFNAILPAAYTYAVVAAKPPKIKGIAPATGYESGGSTVTIAGTDFQIGAIVKFGATDVAPFGVRSTQLDMFAPAHAPGTVDVIVVNPDGQSVTLPAAYTFTPLPAVLPAPTATSVAPNQATTAGGTPVTVAGTNFVAGTKVLFDGIAGAVTAFTSTGITVTTPPHFATGFFDVTVVNPDGQVATLASAFLYLGSGPVINTVSPHACPMAGGCRIVIAGINVAPTATVTVGGVPATNVAWDSLNNVLAATVPPGPGGAPPVEAFVNVVLTNPDGQAATYPQFRYGAAPNPTSFTPTTITTGKVLCQSMTITGTNFSVPSTGAGRSVQVLVGAGLAAFPDALGNPPASLGCNKNTTPLAQPTPTQLQVFLPATPPGSYRVIVTNFDGQFTPAPGIFFLPGP